MSGSRHVVVAGGGVFGVTAALELARRGAVVTLVERGSLPDPLAASTDISKVCRMEYGADVAYTALMEEARRGWLAWNERRVAADRDPLYHETGVLMTSLERMVEGGFEYESHRVLLERGHRPERLDGTGIAARFPAWRASMADGFFHRLGGWVESGRVVEWLAEEARTAGVTVVEQWPLARVVADEGRAVAVEGPEARRIECSHVVLAVGSWTSQLRSDLGSALRRTYHPVWHLRPSDPRAFTPERFPVFTADVARTGYYGFPLHPREGVVKIGNHGPGVVAPAPDLTVPAERTDALRAFLRRHLPGLADAEVVRTRYCPYSDTQDEDFWIASDPELRGVTVAAGGSGHAFKFAPVLGRLVADAVEGREGELAAKFRWRPDLRLERGREAARWHGD